MVNDDQALPSKEASAFKNILKLYDEKQYKKAMKTADSILKKHPNNGETIAMKGLAQYHHYDKPMFFDEKLRDEGFDLVKNGLGRNVRSHVCWHVFGIVQKAKGMFTEAIKAYLGALRIKPENVQILHDTAALQIRTKDIAGFLKTRHQILNLQGTRKSSWVGFAIAHYLARNYNMTQAIIDAYLTTIGSAKGDLGNQYLRSEALLFKARVMIDSGNIDECIKFLTSDQAQNISDSLSMKRTLSSLYLRIGEFEKAKVMFTELIERNMDNLEHHFGFFASISKIREVSKMHIEARSKYDLISVLQSFDEGLKKELMATYRAYKSHKVYSKNWTVDSILLVLLEGNEFREACENILKRNLIKGVPTLFNFFETFYSCCSPKHGRYGASLVGDLISLDSGAVPNVDLKAQVKSKVEVIGSIISSFTESLKINGSFSVSETEKQTPDVWVWAEFFRIQHVFHIDGVEKSLISLNELLEQVPTLLPLYLFKAKVLESCGRFLEASVCLNKARKIDLQDRYINTVCSRSLLRSNCVSEYFNSNLEIREVGGKQLYEEKAFGEEVMSLFSRHEGDARTNLFEMEVIWYSEAVAAAAERTLISSISKNLSMQIIKKQLAFAVKYNKEVVRHFQEYENAQSDFHSYCLRTGGLSCYADFLDHVARVRYDSRFYAASKRLLRLLYFIQANFETLMDDDERIKMLEEKSKSGDISSTEKKQLKQQINQLKKASKNKKNEINEVVPQIQHKKGRRRRQVADKDPTGLIGLKKVKSGLSLEIRDLIALMDLCCSEDIDSCVMLAENAIRQGKLLIALKYLVAAKTSTSLPHLHPSVFCTILLVMALVQEKPVFLFSIGMKSKRIDCTIETKTKRVALQSIADLLGTDETDIAKQIDKYERYIGSLKLCKTGKTVYECQILLCKLSLGLFDQSTFVRKIETALIDKRNSESSYALLKLLVVADVDKAEIERLAKLVSTSLIGATDIVTFF